MMDSSIFWLFLYYAAFLKEADDNFGAGIGSLWGSWHIHWGSYLETGLSIYL
jgi:hypothetical protein